MTLPELQKELESIDAKLQQLRRGEYDIPGDAVFATNMRQYIVESLHSLREDIDKIVLSLDRVDDLDKLKTMRQRIAGGFQKLLGGADE